MESHDRRAFLIGAGAVAITASVSPCARAVPHMPAPPEYGDILICHGNETTLELLAQRLTPPRWKHSLRSIGTTPDADDLWVARQFPFGIAYLQEDIGDQVGLPLSQVVAELCGHISSRFTERGTPADTEFVFERFEGMVVVRAILGERGRACYVREIEKRRRLARAGLW